MTATVQSAPEKSAATRERLLSTALRLYAREGLHAVSLRRISTESGSKNSAAMHYHFQNKLGVVKALVEMIARELRRIANSQRAEKSSQRSLRSACRDTLHPLVLLPARQTWGADGVHFLSRLVSENDADIAAIVNTIYAPFWRRLDHALEEQLPELPTPVRRLRLMFMTTNVLHGVAEVAWLTHTPLGDLSHFDQDTLLNHLVDYLIGGLQAPSFTAANP
ncbi:MAG: TetR/AcrR family transcriptional regulator [Halioglobus sp.]|nr:TetR/AcrR family transcriptional regulator [Halioglobus sp.]